MNLNDMYKPLKNNNIEDLVEKVDLLEKQVKVLQRKINTLHETVTIMAMKDLLNSGELGEFMEFTSDPEIREEAKKMADEMKDVM